MGSIHDILNAPPEDLDPELAVYMDNDGPFGTCIKHPLVFAIAHSDIWNAHVNAQLKYKKAAVEEAEAKGDWSAYIWLHERPYRFQAFIEIECEMSEEDYWQWLGAIWTDSENIWQNEYEWTTYLDPADRNCRELFIMGEEDHKEYDMLPDEFQIYRGFTVEGRENGLSWTTDKIRAKWFARRFAHKGPARLATGWVRKSDVIAYFNGRNESEVVILPEYIRDMKISAVKTETDDE